jgi:hypothetical protein
MVFLLVRWNATRGFSGLFSVYGRNVPGWLKRMQLTDIVEDIFLARR